MPEQAEPEQILERVGSVRWKAGRNFHDELVESIYTDAARIADRAVTRKGERGRFDIEVGRPDPPAIPGVTHNESGGRGSRTADRL